MSFRLPLVGTSRRGPAPPAVQGSAGVCRWAAPVPCTGTSTLPPGASALLCFFPAGESKRAYGLSRGGLLPLPPPSFGVLEEVSSGALGPFLTQGQAPASQTGNMGCVCVCVQVWVSACVNFACISREMRGWVGGGGQREDVTLNTIPHGRNQEAGPVGRPLAESQHCPWGEAVLTCSKSWSASSGRVIVEGCPKCFLISVKQFEPLLCPCVVCVCVRSTSVSACCVSRLLSSLPPTCHSKQA